MIRIDETGLVHFEIYLPHATSVQIRGTFTSWHDSPIDLSPASGGAWVGSARISPGDHQFRYFVDGHRWVTDFAAHGVQMTDFGAWNSGLIVPILSKPIRRAA
jgi:1,4-alpha-glucan branching enzyme